MPARRRRRRPGHPPPATPRPAGERGPPGRAGSPQVKNHGVRLMQQGSPQNASQPPGLSASQFSVHLLRLRAPQQRCPRVSQLGPLRRAAGVLACRRVAPLRGRWSIDLHSNLRQRPDAGPSPSWGVPTYPSFHLSWHICPMLLSPAEFLWLQQGQHPSHASPNNLVSRQGTVPASFAV